MLPSDPSPKATSVQPTTFKEGDRVLIDRFGTRPDDPGVVSSLPIDFTGRIQVALDRGGREWCTPEELVPDVAPPTTFKKCIEKGCPYEAEPNIDRCRGHEMGRPAPNNVDHPSHYTAGGIETITAIEAMVGQKGWSPLTGYRLGNVLKYLWRHAAKGGVESLKKARWYLDREIEAQEAAAPPKVTP